MVSPVIQIDLNRLTYREYRAYLEAGIDEIGILTRVVVAWDLPGDPSQPASYEALGMMDLLRVQAALRAAIAEAVGSLGN